MRNAIRKSLRDVTAIVLLFLIAVGVGGYILSNQRLRFPIIQDKPFQLKASFATAQAVTPGQGQTVRVSGIRIGDISKVSLDRGQALVTMDIEREFKGLVHQDATALLRPKTGLKDMFVELNPGTKAAPAAKPGWTLPIQNTLPDVNLDEVLAALDQDTRDYLKLLVNGAGEGLKGRGGDLGEVFRRFEPTHRDLARVTGALAKRRENLRRLVHSLASLNSELADRGSDLTQLVGASAQVFRAFASEDRNVSATVHKLPGALRATTSALGKVNTLATVLRPTADDLRPVARSLDRANRAVLPFLRETTPVIKNEIRPFVRAARPVVRDLRPAATNLAKATPDLTSTFTVLNHLFNLLGYNPNGAEGPDVKNRQEGYLFWAAWLGHQGNTVFSTSDAISTFRPVFLAGTCGTLRGLAAQAPLADALLNLFPIYSNPTICPK